MNKRSLSTLRKSLPHIRHSLLRKCKPNQRKNKCMNDRLARGENHCQTQAIHRFTTKHVSQTIWKQINEETIAGRIARIISKHKEYIRLLRSYQNLKKDNQMNERSLCAWRESLPNTSHSYVY